MSDMDKGYALGDSMEIHFFAQGHTISATERLPTNFCLFVDHTRCVAFYEDELELFANKDIEFNSIRCAPSDPLCSTGCSSRIANRRARLYWNYVWNHPAHIPTPPSASTEALDALTWFYVSHAASTLTII